MSSIPAVLSYLKFGRAEILKAVEELSWRELTQTPVYEGWTIKDVLAHFIGWDQYVIEILPLIVQNRAGEIAGVDPDDFNHRTITAWRDKPLAEVLAAVKASHQQIVEMISALNHKQIDLRRERQGRFITIRSYVIRMMVEHAREHAAEINKWRTELDEVIDPAAVINDMAQKRAGLLAAIKGLNEADLLTPNAVGVWSVKDTIGHLADWEQMILATARFMVDPSQPAITPITYGDAVNALMAAQRAGQPWAEVLADLTQTRQELLDFVAGLPPEMWQRRGAYPWPDQGTLAELLGGAAWHDGAHAADIESREKELSGN
jgi:uncharacterized damage-inducible protein DinB